MLVVSYRPEFRHTWSTHANVTLHSLTRLSRSEVMRMIKELLREGSLSQQVFDQIIEKADGVPLFIEELTTSIISTPRQNRQRSDLDQTTPFEAAKVPETLHDALMERLDRVAQGRRLAQIAAVIGREFSYDLLTAASRTDETDLRSAFRSLKTLTSFIEPAIRPRCVLHLNTYYYAMRSTTLYSGARDKRFTPISPRY